MKIDVCSAQDCSENVVLRQVQVGSAWTGRLQMPHQPTLDVTTKFASSQHAPTMNNSDCKIHEVDSHQQQPLNEISAWPLPHIYLPPGENYALGIEERPVLDIAYHDFCLKAKKRILNILTILRRYLSIWQSASIAVR